jgi:hypothetical protein
MFMPMSQDEIRIVTETEEVNVVVVVEEPSVINLLVDPEPDVIIVGSAQVGPQGPPGPPGQWASMTQAEYDALDPPDPEILYVIVE